MYVLYFLKNQSLKIYAFGTLVVSVFKVEYDCILEYKCILIELEGHRPTRTQRALPWEDEVTSSENPEPQFIKNCLYTMKYSKKENRMKCS